MLVGELQVQRPKVESGLLEVLGPWDRDGPLGHAPSDRDLRRRGSEVRGHGLQLVRERLHPGKDSAEQQRPQAPGHRVRVALPLAVLSREHTETQGAVRDHMNAEVLANSEQLPLQGSVGQQGELHLARGQRDAPLTEVAVDFHQLLGPVVRNANRLSEALVVDIAQALPQSPLLKGVVLGGGPVELDELHSVQLEPLQGGLARPHEAPARQAPRVRRQLGPDNHAITITTSPLPLATTTTTLLAKVSQQNLAPPVEPPGAVRVPRVKDGSRSRRRRPLHREFEHLSQLLVHALLVPPNKLIPPGPRPRSHPRKTKTKTQGIASFLLPPLGG
mmetsp:Transcript_6773/g.19812  ORF Transcript_6773/g.19812 Transcript_6773/m.19812 type:complete len:332 (+) Transcript_6773:252-1247(+)